MIYGSLFDDIIATRAKFLFFIRCCYSHYQEQLVIKHFHARFTVYRNNKTFFPSFLSERSRRWYQQGRTTSLRPPGRSIIPFPPRGRWPAWRERNFQLSRPTGDHHKRIFEFSISSRSSAWISQERGIYLRHHRLNSPRSRKTFACRWIIADKRRRPLDSPSSSRQLKSFFFLLPWNLCSNFSTWPSEQKRCDENFQLKKAFRFSDFVIHSSSASFASQSLQVAWLTLISVVLLLLVKLNYTSEMVFRFQLPANPYTVLKDVNSIIRSLLEQPFFAAAPFS